MVAYLEAEGESEMRSLQHPGLSCSLGSNAGGLEGRTGTVVFIVRRAKCQGLTSCAGARIGQSRFRGIWGATQCLSPYYAFCHGPVETL